MAIFERFAPSYRQGVLVAATSTTASTAVGVGSKTLCISNLGTNAVYVHAGPSGVAATTADMLIMPNGQFYLTKDQDFTHVAYISPGGTSLHILPGEGF